MEAAVAYAKHVAGEVVEEAERVAAREEVAAEEAEAEVVDGYTLLRSRNSTGYAGVYPNKGRFLAKLWSGGKNINLGSYSTAVEAAVAYAKHVAGEVEEPEEEEEAEVVTVTRWCARPTAAAATSA